MEEKIRIVRKFNQENRYRDGGVLNNAIDDTLNELERLQKENALKNKKTVHTCLHCGNDTPLYCENCYQELISKNAELQSDNYEIKNTYRRTAQHLNNIGKTELADYMLAQINDVPVWCVGDDKNFIPKQVLRNRIADLEEAKSKYNFLIGTSYRADGAINTLKEILGDE